MMKVIVQKAAARQISRVYTYGEQHFGKQTAEKTHARIMEALRLLAALWDTRREPDTQSATTK